MGKTRELFKKIRDTKQGNISCKMRKKVKLLSHVRLFAIPWTVAYQAPPSMEFSRQEYWSEFPFPSPGDLPSPGTVPASLSSPGPSEVQGWNRISFVWACKDSLLDRTLVRLL